MPCGGIERVRSLRTTFSQISPCGRRRRDVHAIEREVGCFRALVVAGDAVAIDDGARVDGGVRRIGAGAGEL